MAIHNPSNLYSGGQVMVDSTPFTKVVLNDLAKKAAAKEAVNKSMADLMGKINIAGVRQQDLQGEHGGILNDIENWKQNAIANKNEIAKGGAAQQRHIMDLQKILYNIDQSKQNAKDQLEWGKLHQQGKLDIGEEDLPVFAKKNTSIYDPTHYKEDGSELGYEDLPANLPKFTPDKQSVFFKTSFGKNEPTYDETKARVDKVTGDVFIPQGYKPEQIKQIANNTGNTFDGSPEAQRHYKKQLTNAEFMTDANHAFNVAYGRDIENAREAAQADAILRAMSANKEIKVTDPNYANFLKQQNIRLSAKLHPPKSNNTDENIGYISDEVANEKAKPYTIKDGKTLSDRKVVWADEVDPERLNIITGAENNGANKGMFGVKPILIKQYDKPGAPTRLGYFVEPGTGDWIGKDNQKISREAAKDRYIKQMAPSKFKAQVGTKAAEGKSTKKDPLGIL